MGDVLVVYDVRDRRLRDSVRDHLLAFERHSSHRCHYLNLGVRRATGRWRRLDPDLVVFHTTFLSKRHNPVYWADLLDRASALRGAGRVRVALPQDEYLPPARLCEFVEDFEIGHVFSVAPESEWDAIYPTVDREHVGISRVLTGYLEDTRVRQVTRLGPPGGKRDIDIGYRAKELPFWLGRHGLLKSVMAQRVEMAAGRRGLSCDISTRREDTLLEDDWLRFLLRSKYTIGAEGGASLLDRDGSLKTSVERYLAEHPGASFEAVEAACFPGRDGELALVALSPRHLEACATSTCQVLVEGDYNGVLEAGRHYIPLREDLSNLDEVVDELARDRRREQIAEAAYADIVASGRYTYRKLVGDVEAVMPPRPARDIRPGQTATRLSMSRAGERIARGRLLLLEARTLVLGLLVSVRRRMRRG
jgi:hypothetical protein